MSLVELGELFGVSKQRVEQLQAQGLAKVRRKLTRLGITEAATWQPPEVFAAETEAA